MTYNTIRFTRTRLIKLEEDEAQVEPIEQGVESNDFGEDKHQHRSPIRNQMEQEKGQIKALQSAKHPKGFEIQPTKPVFRRCISLDKPHRNKKKPYRFGLDQDEVNYAIKEIQLLIKKP